MKTADERSEIHAGGRAGELSRALAGFAAPHTWVVAAVLIRICQGIHGVGHYAYMGQDFQIHLDHLASLAHGFPWQGTNPPLLYLMAWFIRKHLTQSLFLELTSIVFLALNLASVPIIAMVLKRLGFSARTSALCLILLIFLPFWVVHSAVFAADVFSVPFFFLIVELLFRLFEERGIDDRREIAILAGLGVALTLGVYAKYTFLYVLAAAAVLVAWRYRKERRRLFRALLIACLLPGALGLYELRMLYRARSFILYGAYVAGADYPETDTMRLKDIFLPKRADLDLLAAPEFSSGLNEPYRYSYPSLLHVTAFTDSFRFFQSVAPSQPVWNIKRRVAFEETRLTSRPAHIAKSRGAAARWASPLAVILSLPLSVSALWGTLRAVGRAIRVSLGKLEAPVERDRALILAMALSWYLPVFLALPRVAHAYRFGYWLPRLVMPSLMVFLMFGFMELGRIMKPFAVTHRLLPAVTAVLATVYILAL